MSIVMNINDILHQMRVKKIMFGLGNLILYIYEFVCTNAWSILGAILLIMILTVTKFINMNQEFMEPFLRWSKPEEVIDRLNKLVSFGKSLRKSDRKDVGSKSIDKHPLRYLSKSLPLQLDS